MGVFLALVWPAGYYDLLDQDGPINSSTKAGDALVERGYGDHDAYVANATTTANPQIPNGASPQRMPPPLRRRVTESSQKESLTIFSKARLSVHRQLIRGGKGGGRLIASLPWGVG
jgi:hypothetical protein